jgi:hypothetical protein
MLTAVPATPRLGVNPVIDGAFVPTVKVPALIWLEPQVTITAPVVTPIGTVVTICVVVAERTPAARPLKVTVGFEQKPVPYIVIVVPETPLLELRSRAANVADE